MGRFFLCGLIFFLPACTINEAPIPRRPAASPAPGYDLTGQPSTGAPWPAPGSGGDPNSSGSRDQVFPFKINIDTISYMGCPDPSARDPIFTSFKLGAYNTGLSLTDEFQEKIKQYKTKAQRKIVLRDSVFVNARGQASISRRGDARENLLIQNQPIRNFFPSINNPTALDDLAGDFSADSVGVNNPLEVILPVPGNILQHILSYLASSHHITLTYNNGATPQPLGPGHNQYYGKSYQIGFDRNLNYMENINEYDLLSGKKGKKWSCLEKSRLVILRHDQISEREYLRGKEYYDSNNMAREAVCIQDRSALSRVGKKNIEDILPENLFVVGFVHTWRTEGETQTLEETDEVCLTTQTAHWSCYSQSNTARLELNKRDCRVNNLYARCPAYFSFCTRK